MQPRDRLTAKEIQVATLVWQGLTNKDIAKVLITSEQVVKNYLRTAFDKLGVWTRLELALYVAAHGSSNWHLQLGNGLLSPSTNWGVGAVDQGSVSQSRVAAGLEVQERNPRHRLVAAGQDDLCPTPEQLLGSRPDGLQPAATQPVHGKGRCAVRQTRSQRHTAGVVRIRSDLTGTAEDHLVDLVLADPAPFKSCDRGNGPAADPS